MKAKTIALVVLALLVLITIFQNTQVVTFRFLFWEPSMSRIIWLILFILIGILIGYLSGTIREKKHAKRDVGP